MDTLSILMAVLGAEPVASPIFSNNKLLNHKNWRVREGVLKLYTAQVLGFNNAAVSPGDEFVIACANALVDAQPEMRRAATDAFATMGVQRRGDITGVLAKLNKVAEARGIAIKGTHHQAIKDKFHEYQNLGSPPSAAGAAAGGGGGGYDAPGADGGDEDGGWDNSGHGGRGGGGGGGGGLGSTASSLGSGGGGSASSAPPSASKLRLKVPGPSDGPSSLGSSHGSNGFGGGGSGGGGGAPLRARAATASGSGSGSSGGGWGSSSSQAPSSSPQVPSVSFGVLQEVDFDEVASDPSLPSLCQLASSSPHWQFGVLGGFTPAEVGAVKPIEVTNPRDLARLIDGVIAACSTTSTDWAERAKALDRVRGLVAGGKTNPSMSVDGFAQQISRLRDCLCTQVQELRSTLAKQACLAVVELSAVLSEAGLAFAFEPCAEALAETLIKLTAVSIAVISSSADAAIKSVLHNAAKIGGYHRVLPRLTAGCRSKSGATRAHAAQYLLTTLRGWPKACLDRHADEICATVLGLIRDADPDARLAGRHSFWSLASLYPSRIDSMVLSKLDQKLQKTICSDEARHAAIEAACHYLSEPTVVLTDAPSSFFGGGGAGFAPTPSALGGDNFQNNGFGGSSGGGGGAASSSNARPQTSFAGSGAQTGGGSNNSAAATPVGGSGPGGFGGQGIAQKEKPQTAGARVVSSAPSTPKGGGGGAAAATGPQRVAPQGNGFGFGPVPQQAGPGPGPSGASAAPPVSATSSSSASSSSAYRHYYSDPPQQPQQPPQYHQQPPSQEANAMPSLPSASGANSNNNAASRASMLPPSSSAAAAAFASSSAGGAVRVPVTSNAAPSSAASTATTITTTATARSDVASARSVLSHTAGVPAVAAAPKTAAGGYAASANTSFSGGSSSSYASSTPVQGAAASAQQPTSPASLSGSVLSTLISRALGIARGSPRATDLYTSSASSPAGHPLRLAISQLLQTLVLSRALDARSVCRVYAERLPEQLSSVIPDAMRAEFCVPGPATQPLLSDGQLDAAAALVVASHLQQAGGNDDSSSSSSSSCSPVVSLVLACLRHAHEYVQLDALALIFSLLDACVDVGGPLSDALSDVMLAPAPAFSSSGTAAASATASSFGPEAVVIDYSTSVRLFTVKVTNQSGVSSAAVATPSSAAAGGAVVVSIMPVFARLILQQGGASSSSSASNNNSNSISLSPSFIELLHLVVALSSVGGSEAVRLAARRVISALRRAFTVPVLLAGVIACMSRPLSLSSASSGSGAAGGEEDAGALTSRTHAAALMLTLSLLGDAGACDFLFSHSPSLTRLLSRAAAMATSPAPAHLLAGANGGNASAAAASSSSAAAAQQRMTGYVEGIMRILGQSSPVKVGAALQLLKPEERSLMVKLANNVGLDAKAMMVSAPSPSAFSPAPAAAPAAAPIPANPTITFGGGGAGSSTAAARPATATATATSSSTSISSGAAATPMPTSSSSSEAAVSTSRATLTVSKAPSTASSSASAGATPASAGGAAAAAATNIAALPFPVSKSNLELIRDSLVSGDLERVTRALHYLGRQVDITPSTATSSSTSAAVAGAGGLSLLPTSLAPVPFPHNEDPAYLALVERVVAGVLTVVEHAAGLKATNIGGGRGGGAADSSGSVAPVVVTTNATFNLLAENGTGTVDAVLLSTALSVVRKLYRNAPSYMLSSCGPTFITLISACRYANREQLVVLERSLDEVAEKMPVDVTLVHLIAAIAGSPCAIPELSAICIASFRALTRCVPRIPSHYLLNECAKGRLMTAAVDGFNSPSTEVRRSVVQLLAALSISLRSHFTRYVDAYLSVPQSKLLSIYVEKALNQQQHHQGGGGGALAGLTPAK